MGVVLVALTHIILETHFVTCTVWCCQCCNTYCHQWVYAGELSVYVQCNAGCMVAVHTTMALRWKGQ